MSVPELFEDFGTKIELRRTAGRVAMRWSGSKCTWLRERDVSGSLIAFVSAGIKEVTLADTFELSVTALREMSSSATKFMIAILGSLLKRGCSIELRYDPNCSDQQFLFESLRSILSSEQTSRLAFVADTPVTGEVPRE